MGRTIRQKCLEQLENECSRHFLVIFEDQTALSFYKAPCRFTAQEFLKIKKTWIVFVELVVIAL